MDNSIDSLDLGPDWITVTTDHYGKTMALRAFSEGHLHATCVPKPWRFLNYIGRTMHDPSGRGGMAYGERHGGEQGILQAWGELSNRVGHELATQPVRVSRVDLQVTVLHKAAQPRVRDFLHDLDNLGHHYNAVIPVGQEGGTLYIGHRSSDIFGRMYDKGAQLGLAIPPSTLWRYEVEYKRAPAINAAAHMWRSGMTPDDRRDFIMRNVETFFREHGIPTPFVAGADNHHAVVRYATRQADSERTLKWLSQQVHPAILRLSLEGKAEQVAKAMGLTVTDGVPTFDVLDIVPAEQYELWPTFDKMEDSM